MLRSYEVIKSKQKVECHICGKIGHYYKGKITGPLGIPMGLCDKHFPKWTVVREVVDIKIVIQGVGHETSNVPMPIRYKGIDGDVDCYIPPSMPNNRKGG